MSLFYQPRIQTEPYLDEDESRHAVKVLRLGTGDALTIVDGRGGWYTAEILRADARRCTVRLGERRQEVPRPYRIHLAIAPTKHLDRMEWMLEKCVEIGVDEISFLETRYSERRHLKLDRLERIAVGAMKQSQRGYLPDLHDLRPFGPWLEAQTGGTAQRWIAHLDEGERHLLHRAAAPLGTHVVLIGPEGDFSPEEIARARQAGFRAVSLGASRLRTETAGLVAVHTLNLLNQ